MQRKSCDGEQTFEVAILDVVEAGRPYLAPVQNVCEGAHDRA